MSKDVVGIAGCGAMGLPMAQRLADAGYEVWGHDVRPVGEFGEFANRMVGDAAGFSERCNIVISVVRDAAQTRALLFGESQGIVKGLQPPDVLVISSTLSPRFIRHLSKELPEGLALVDAAMSGAPYRARSGTLSFMLGGPDDVLERLTPLFEVMGEDIFRIGPASMGMTAKVLNNYCAATSVVATHRVLGMARALELDERTLLNVMKVSSGSNWFADRIDQIDWASEGYSTSNTIGIVEKDVESALDAVSEHPAVAHAPLDDALLASLRALESLKID
ncbi:MAG TPA: NAD(P)-dependent oxidoreductase [Arenicellales bacterium]|jgi:3-hydroxyisobutyrate dehydrogenase-like beta-hydroxyacid dehydrogenase|nr:NAD(P)-dependent oxidoreductase [Arenicellales bacterium]MDP6267780.1 NAD(P)-dependent oxidoreductase [Arenicellales bacterium]HJL52062.1 NAD(P)-dependent oxidoreductase [Arenicellales bacterium]|tara:strand:+ start:456 stop:1289 length:834 start_codon:yes stop_codon:yes gene_type:complete